MERSRDSEISFLATGAFVLVLSTTIIISTHFLLTCRLSYAKLLLRGQAGQSAVLTSESQVSTRSKDEP